MQSGSDILIYQTDNGQTRIRTRLENETIMEKLKADSDQHHALLKSIGVEVKQVGVEVKQDVAAVVE